MTDTKKQKQTPEQGNQTPVQEPQTPVQEPQTQENDAPTQENKQLETKESKEQPTVTCTRCHQLKTSRQLSRFIRNINGKKITYVRPVCKLCINLEHKIIYDIDYKHSPKGLRLLSNDALNDIHNMIMDKIKPMVIAKKHHINHKTAVSWIKKPMRITNEILRRSKLV